MRIQLDFDKEGSKWLKLLEKATGARTHKEFFNNAMTLFVWAIEQRQDNRIIASMDEQSGAYKELQMPALEHARISLFRDTGDHPVGEENKKGIPAVARS